jgi:hypothetical protein
MLKFKTKEIAYSIYIENFRLFALTLLNGEE